VAPCQVSALRYKIGADAAHAPIASALTERMQLRVKFPPFRSVKFPPYAIRSERMQLRVEFPSLRSKRLLFLSFTIWMRDSCFRVSER